MRLAPHRAQHLRSFSRAQHPEAFLRISPASTAFTVDSVRVRWLPVLQSFHRRGAFAMGAHPRVHGFPVRRLLCPIRRSPGASRFRKTFPSHDFPTALDLSRGVSRVPYGRLQQHEGGGVFLSLPLPLVAAPQSLDRGENRVTSVTLAPVSGWPWSLLSPLVYDCRLAWLTEQTRAVRGSLPRRALPRFRGCTMSSLSQAPPLGGLSPPHGAFQGHAAHVVEWSATLRSKGSWGACTRSSAKVTL